MIKLALITPTRGNERAAFVKQAARLIQKQTRQPDAWYLIDYAPAGNTIDLHLRLREGVRRARADNMTHVAFWEDDDYYRKDYLANMLHYLSEDTDILGETYVTGYQLKALRWYLRPCGVTQGGVTRGADLHRTIASVYYMENSLYDAPIDSMCFIDHYLWEKAHATGVKYKYVDNAEIDCVTMKHGVGRCGTSFHRSEGPQVAKLFPNLDPTMVWLRKFTGEDFDFYEDQVKTLNGVPQEVI